MATKARPRISTDGLWLLIVFKTAKDFDEVPLSVQDLPDTDKQWVLEHLNKIVSSIRTSADLDRLLQLVDEVGNGDPFDTLERLSMLF